jgi:ABC-type Zn uptake system ZnuABC Zn-binding protein ZnuA
MRAFFLAVIFVWAGHPLWSAPLQVVASTSDLAAVAREIGGEDIRVEVLCRADQDPHEFELVPKQVIAVQSAAVYLKVGVALDLWADGLIKSANNSRLVVADCSKNLDIIGAPKIAKDKLSDAHPFGNPHYWLAPSNLPRIAQNIRDAFLRADPAHADLYKQRCTRFTARADSAFAQWKELLAPCRGKAIYALHPAWDYFAQDFDLLAAGVVSPIPDVEPSPSELVRLETKIRATGGLFLREPYGSDRLPALLNRDTGIPVITVPTSAGETDVWTFFESLTRTIAGKCSAHE